MTIDRKEVEVLIWLFEQSDWRELRLETDGLKLVLSKDADAVPLRSIVETSAEDDAAASPDHAPPALTPDVPGAPAEGAPADGLIPINAPNLGTFYRAPKPGAAPYVEVGQEIGETTEVCLIEVMKLFTPVRAGISGRIAKACVEDGEMVEFGAPLFLVKPEAETAEPA